MGQNPSEHQGGSDLHPPTSTTVRLYILILKEDVFFTQVFEAIRVAELRL